MLLRVLFGCSSYKHAPFETETPVIMPFARPNAGNC
jgi:hypothetical protein